jgi:hypothetical protein
MASQFRLVSAIINDVRIRADIEGQTDRHPDAQLIRWVNESIQMLRSLLTDMGFEYFLTATSPGDLSTTAAATGETYSEQDWPKDAARIYGVDVLASDGFWVKLRPISMSQIRHFQYAGYGYSGPGFAGDCPAAYALRLAPFGSTSTETVGKIAIVPLPRVSRKFRIWYLSNWEDLASSSTFNGHEGWVEWVVNDVCVKVATRDQEPTDDFLRRRAELEMIFGKSAPRANSGGPITPVRADGDYAYGGEWYPTEIP